MLRITHRMASCVMLATTFLLAGCTLMLLNNQPREFSLKNKCPFPVLVVITYESGVERNVNLDAGDKEGQTTMENDPADSLKVIRDGNELYTFSLVRDRGILTYDLNPTGVTIQGH
jgi:hypothetical protein